jgi:hypothetical protein
MKRFRFTVLTLMVLLAGFARADDEVKVEDSNRGGANPQIEAVDIPTAEVLDPMTFSTTFRFYNEGGLTSRFLLGPLKRVNLGISFDGQRVIGSGDPHFVTPAVYFKVKAYDGNDYLPAFALGYDNQGMLWQESNHEYMHEGKGIYFVGSHEIFVPNFDLHAGMNVNNLDDDGTLYGFFGTTFKLAPGFALLMEYDNIRNGRDNRFNVGGRFWVAPYFNIDFAARNIPHGSERGGERILRLNYVGHFPF